MEQNTTINLFLFKLGNTIDKNERISVYKTFSNPISYTLNYKNSSFTFSDYELICDDKIGFETHNALGDYTNQYISFWFVLLKIRENGAWLANNLYLEYGVSNLECHSSEEKILCCSFLMNNLQYRIFFDVKCLLQEYADVRQDYFVFYDDKGERDTIESKDVFSVLNNIVKVIGKDNIFTDVDTYIYIGSTNVYDVEGNRYLKQITQKFYILYNTVAPSLETKKKVIREKLIADKGSRDQAALEYPDLFTEEYRTIYRLRENKGFPINVVIMEEFLADNYILNPEIILMMDLKCPIIVENGVSDIIENYSPIRVEEEDYYESNQFIFFLSSVFNYIDGLNTDVGGLKNTTGFIETDEWVQFSFSNISWRVMK